MDLINAPKEGSEPGGLRLVPEQRDAQKFPALQKQFVNFMFFRVSPEWRKLDAETKMAFKKEFEEVYKGFSDDLLLFSYSLVGFDSKADLMLWRIGNSLDLIQEMTAVRQELRPQVAALVLGLVQLQHRNRLSARCRKACLPNGSPPTTMKSTSSSIRSSTVRTSLFRLAVHHVSTIWRIACSSVVLIFCGY